MNMSDMTKKLYPVTGMHCAACAGNVEKIVRKQEGVEKCIGQFGGGYFGGDL